jgi:hypothetical protein
MQELLIGSLGAHIVAFVGKYPWQVFAVVLVATLIVADLFRRSRSVTGSDLDIFNFGTDCDGGCGD